MRFDENVLPIAHSTPRAGVFVFSWRLNGQTTNLLVTELKLFLEPFFFVFVIIFYNIKANQAQVNVFTQLYQ